ncbi:hypothetical protein LCGC14_0342390 [marine sediment metagenome]|uniref:Uncharacterized protein n=1 Tax=marine sediment metagenome TaxID=412755 RepID=A0A0F9TW89_9ZZZZ
MSKFIEEIVTSIKSEPLSWEDNDGGELVNRSKGVLLLQYGNGVLLSCINVLINGKETPTTYFDGMKLEHAIKKWYKGIGLEHLRGKTR